MTLNIRGVDLAGASETLVLVISPKCRHCLRSAPFYKVLAADAHLACVPLIVAVPEKSEAESFISGAGLGAATIRIWEDLPVAVPGTPTLLVLDSSGSIQRIWYGELSTKRQSDVRALLKDSSLLHARPTILGTGEANLREGDLERLMKQQRTVILDIRERPEFASGHHRGATNIPLIELPTRLTHELQSDVLTVIDCSRLVDQRLCQNAVERLSEHGFRWIAALNGDMTVTNVCKVTPTY